jgi:hypothetical protein
MTMYIDENNAADVLAPLRDESPAPPRIDLGQVKGEARRRLRRHHLATASGAVACMAAIAVAVPLGVAAVRHAAPTSHPSVPAAASASTKAVPTSLSCTESLLPVPDGVTKALVGGGDPTGRYLIGRSYPGDKVGKEQPLIWDNGVAHKVAVAGEDAGVVAISSNGTAVAESFNGNTQSAFIYRDGKLTNLGGMTNVGPVAVNDAGTVAGIKNDNDTLVPIVWRTPTSPATALPMPGPKWRGRPSAVLSDGTIIGSIMPTFDSMTSTGVIWKPDGTFELLPLPKIAGVTGINGFNAFNVSKNVLIGEAVESTSQETTFYPVAYDLTTGTYTDLSQAKMWLSGGNAQHWLVGSTGGLNAKPALWTPGTGIIRLPALTAKGGDIGNQPAFVSDDGGVLAGQDTDKHGVIRAVVWHCH